MPKIFGGGQKQPSAAPTTAGAVGAPAGGAKLFNPEQIAKATKDYSAQGGAKWNQIMAGMGAGGGTGGDFNKAIESQAQTMGSKLGELTDQSGYGADGMGQLAQILKSVEGGIGAQYPVF